MIYLIESDNLVVINTKIEQILKKNKLNKDGIIRYDLLEVPLEVLINELDTYNLLTDKKIVIGENASFLSSSKVKSINTDTNELEKYVNNPNKDNILILICNKLDNKKKIVKLLKDKGEVLSNEISIDKIIKDSLDDYSMDNRTINYLINYCSNDIERILNELEKLKCFKLNDKVINISDIDEVVFKSLDDNVFDFINAVVSKNKNKAYDIYKELLYKGEEETKLVIMVADQIRLIYNCKVLLLEGMKKDDIASYLEVHPYKVKLAIESSYSYTKEELLKMLSGLYEIDKSIKTGREYGKFGLELFILSL